MGTWKTDILIALLLKRKVKQESKSSPILEKLNTHILNSDVFVLLLQSTAKD